MHKSVLYTLLFIFFIITPTACKQDTVLVVDSTESENTSQNDPTITDNNQTENENNTDSTSSSSEETINTTEAETITPVKVAFIGDQGLGDDSLAVLELILNEEANMVLHQGDFDYQDDPDSWDEQITNVLGENFPYFASVGNHDLSQWDAYQTKLSDRLNRISEAICQGDLGVQSACAYKGVFFILSGVGTAGDESEHLSYIQNELANNNSNWKICSWHKNQTLMQVGIKSNDTGWGVYDACREQGAIIATAHHHSYSRTHLMQNFENQIIGSTASTLILEKGKTFAFVSGLGGASIYGQDDDLADNGWWASVYNSEQNATYGALFCTFNENNTNTQGSCYFKNINGEIIDEFSLVSNINN